MTQLVSNFARRIGAPEQLGFPGDPAWTSDDNPRMGENERPHAERMIRNAQLVDQTPDPFDIFLWSDPEVFNGTRKVYAFREIVYFHITTMLDNDIQRMTQGRYSFWGPTLQGTEQEDFEKAATWAIAMSGIMSNYATNIERNIRNGILQQVEAKRAISARKISVALMHLARREFDDESIAFTLSVAYHMDTLREGWNMAQSIARNIVARSSNH